MRARAAAVLAAALALGACGGGAHRARAQADPPSCPAGASTVAGAPLHVPAGARPGHTPLLVVVIPGGGGDRHDVLGLTKAAGARGIAVVYPTTTARFWTLNDAQGRQQVDDATALLDRLVAGGCFDPARVSITGVSNGAGFATRLACGQPGRFHALVAVAAGFRALDPCPANGSFEAIHGRADTVVPFNGKKPGREGSVPAFTQRWSRRAGCAPAPVRTHPRPLVERIAYRGCRGGRRVAIVALTGTTHTWPGATGLPFPSRNPSHFHATDEVVRFISA
jgi:polyhydroxybutyrate depolymerase